MFLRIGIALSSVLPSEEWVGAIKEQRPQTHEKERGRAQDSPSKQETSLLVKGMQGLLLGTGVQEPMNAARPVLLLTCARERFQFGLCPTF